MPNWVKMKLKCALSTGTVALNLVDIAFQLLKRSLSLLMRKKSIVKLTLNSRMDWPNMSMNPNRWQKSLDKSRLMLYNMKSKVRKKRMKENVLGKWSETTNKAYSEYTKNYIVSVGKAIKDVCENNKSFANLRCPVIAGGSVRDMVFGLLPRDIDVFVDMSCYEDEDERKDQLLLLSDEIRLALVKNRKPYYKYAPSENVNQYTGTVDFSFEVYNLFPLEPWEDELEGLPAEPEEVEPFPIEALELPEEVPTRELNNRFAIQIIGKNDKRLSENPTKYVMEDFDYSFVKALYDPLIEEFILSDEFMDNLGTKEVFARDQTSFARIQNWLSRYSYASNANPFIPKYAATAPAVNADSWHRRNSTTTLSYDAATRTLYTIVN